MKWNVFIKTQPPKFYLNKIAPFDVLNDNQLLTHVLIHCPIGPLFKPSLLLGLKVQLWTMLIIYQYRNPVAY